MARKRNYRRTSTRKTADTKATQALRLARQANKTELKYADYALSAGTPGSYTITDLGSVATNPSQGLNAGPDYNQRIGNSVMAKSMHFRTSITKHSSASAQQVRIIIFRSLNEQRSNLVTQYLQDNNINSQKSVDHRFDTKTLYDRTFVLDEQNPKKIWNYKLKMNWPVHYDPTTGAVDRGAIGIIFISDENSANLPTLSPNGTARYFFTDK